MRKKKKKKRSRGPTGDERDWTIPEDRRLWSD
jgi:hypothetical protein